MPDNPLTPLVHYWEKKIKLAWEHKQKHFQDDADDAMRFYSGPYDFMYKNEYRGSSKGFVYQGNPNMPSPTFRMTVNKVAEMVQIYGPVLYHTNPVRAVNPREVAALPEEFFFAMGDAGMMAAQQMVQQVSMQRGVDAARAMLVGHLLNYTPNALGLKDHSRRSIDEALIKGAGLLWTEVYQPPGSPFKMVGSFHDSVDNLVVDPDMETIEDAYYIARKYTRPVWQVEQEYMIPPGTLKRGHASFDSVTRAIVDDEVYHHKRRGQTNDLVTYWRIYSKMGMGTYLQGVPRDMVGQFEMFGPYVHLVVVEGEDFFLNLNPWLMEAYPPEQLMQFAQWPTPFWADDGWPFTKIAFHDTPREVWPMSHIKPAMGELKFLNWAYSFLAGKIRTASRDFLAVMKAAGEELKRTLLTGSDYEMIELESKYGKISEVVQFLQHPPFHGDIFKVIEAIEHNFERRTGLTELMYGQTAFQMRSATEAQVKSDTLRVRPDDMANKVEDAMSEVARKEAIASRWHLTGQDVLPIMGPQGAQYWQQLVMASDPSKIIHELEYRIEAGSARKPNKERDQQNMQDAMQTLFAPLWQFAMQTGDVRPVNEMLRAWAKTIDLDADKFLIQPPPMPMGPGGEPGAEQPAVPAA